MGWGILENGSVESDSIDRSDVNGSVIGSEGGHTPVGDWGRVMLAQ